MKWEVCKDYESISQKAAELIREKISEKKARTVMGFATGSTPIRTYQKMIEMYEKKECDFSNMISVNLDEYIGLSREDEQSYYRFMHENLFDHINIKEENIHLPDPSGNPSESARDYDALLDSVGRRDIQILGIGTNGHIAFNEPNDFLGARTTIIDLNESTISDNARFFDTIDDVPKQAISMGIADILNADLIILLISGKNKQKVVEKLYHEKKITTHFPASLLHVHQNVIVLVDEDAYGSVRA